MKYTSFLVDEFSVIAIFNQLKSLFDERFLLLESMVHNENGNYSFIFIGEKERVVYKNEKTYYFDGKKEHILNKDPFSFFKEYFKKIDFTKYKELSQKLNIAFVDGFVGYIGYDLVKVFEPVLKKVMDDLKDEINIPDLYFIRPKIVIGYSHKFSTLTIIINDKSYEKYLYIMRDLINSTYTHKPLKCIKGEIKERLLFSKEEFIELVKKAKEHIRAGDIFQIVLSNRLIIEADVDGFSFYRKLRSKNPSPYLFYLDYKDFILTGSSPEVMVKLDDGEILLRPIAGTRKRGKTLKEDLALEEEMKNDEKEVAEHIMLVDLGRNDVGRVAKAGSVRVEELMRVERYSHVMHLVSDVVGELDSNYDMFDLFKATFTAGTMTGAPKIKAMELIAKYEGIKRGFYAGSVGYFGFNGNMDSAITIRSALIKDKKIILQAGAGVVADSKPELEFKEINNKLRALRTTIEELRCE
jgi:anthranilate synthase component 1